MPDIVRVYEIGEETGSSSQDVIAKAKDLGIKLKSPQSAVSYEDAENITNYMMTGLRPKTINKANANIVNIDKKDNDLIKNIKSIGLIIKDLKQIKELEFNINLEKRIYAIIGNNGVGKSSLITCLGKLIEPTCLREEFKAKNCYSNTKIIYKINNSLIEWTKPKNWTVSKNDNIEMPKFNGVFEASLITGKRFTHIEHKNKTIQQNQLKFTMGADSFIIENLDYILNGSMTKKYDGLSYLSSNKVKELYFLKYGNDYITEFYFSAGEYFLLSILKFINEFGYKKNKENLGLIIIDEIEISLHPLAQKRLIEKLKEFKDKYNLLIIFATHSLHIIDNIDPKDVYYFENKDGICSMSNPIHKGYLSSRLYEHSHYDKIILVEDDLAKKFINKLIKDDNVDNLLYEIISVGGWEKVLEIYRINENSKIYSNAEVIVVLDGDVNSKEKAAKGIYSDIKKRFLPIENIEKYTVTKLYIDNDVRKKIERNFLGHKTLESLPINIKTNTTEEIKQSYKKGIIEEIQKASGKSVYSYQIEDFLIEEIINKLKKEENENIEKFKKNILDFLK
ncbi:translation initiation factor IF-2 N-terminal domain-containing protein [Arcobacter lacus]|nr:MULTISPECIES: translation initiation factor IF-2 N-terminal domain-containing protein [Arcobacteraceae]MCT7591530.1 translation initiation factor IF-2 N-terminal domain-containing protein [Aliarcobacter butzleri]MCT7910299.1 translation initiation factor IF-2 N-terminal domain-containing protein [Arcobacter lacus]MDN5061816.1 translation initiation factor IF-2 N-terminal domain-containing protein [Aliarcobacter butzleri]NUW26981.1 translation initiation factor IF-2 N-terminal domain-containi